MPSTGDALLNPPPGGVITLAYNTVQFSVLFKSEISGEYLLDDAGRTVKAATYTLTVEGIVSSAGGTPLEQNFATLRELLSQPGGVLIYQDRGFGDLAVNQVGGNSNDIAWGPIPKVLFFQPYGNGFSAHVRWQCTFTISEAQFITTGRVGPVVQFSYESMLTYDEDNYTGISIRGVLEVPLTRISVNDRTIPPLIVDRFREQWLNISFDLTQFRVVSRNFNESADKRTCKWDYRVEELPPMTLTPGAVRARGVMSVQPLKLGNQRSMLLLGTSWTCTLRGSYTIRKDFPRRSASLAFCTLLSFRMRSSIFGVMPANDPNNAGQQAPPNATAQFAQAAAELPIRAAGIDIPFRAIQQPRGNAFAGVAGTGAQALLANFSFDEPLYLDSRVMNFEASWILFTTFRSLMDASGVWRWPADGTQRAYSGTQPLTWAASVQGIVGWRSWLANQLNPNADVIVDMGGGLPLQPQRVVS